MTRRLNPTPIEQAGSYVLHLYCRYLTDDIDHDVLDQPSEFFAEKAAECRDMARNAGWTIHRDGTATCPQCNRDMAQ